GRSAEDADRSGRIAARALRRAAPGSGAPSSKQTSESQTKRRARREGGHRRQKSSVLWEAEASGGIFNRRPACSHTPSGLPLRAAEGTSIAVTETMACEARPSGLLAERKCRTP